MSGLRWTESELRSALERFDAELRHASKAPTTVLAYVEHAGRFIDWLVGAYQPRPGTRRMQHDGSAGPTSRYDPLGQHLAGRREEPRIMMSFAEIERVIGGPLPASARAYRTWWSNERNGSHVQARAWLSNGRETHAIDLNAATVEFIVSTNSETAPSST